jgi:NAD+ synthase (glutamine-hydrolysing)
VGDIPGNTLRVLEAIDKAREQSARVVIFPELVLTGYPPEDLLLRPALQERISTALKAIIAASAGIYVVIGYPARRNAVLYNAAGVFFDGVQLVEYHKQWLPNYGVFDEKRYFVAGDRACVFLLDGISVALSICEDIWHPEPMQQAQSAGARLMLSLNASPFHIGKPLEREQELAKRAVDGGMPVLYVNMVGAQDELVFDGGSCAVNEKGELIARANAFEEDLLLVNLIALPSAALQLLPVSEMAVCLDDQAAAYRALVIGVRDYVTKNHFHGVVLGLSGGIDSALTLAVAVDALGSERVQAVMMPYRYTSDMSLQDASEQAAIMGVQYSVIPIEPVFNAFMTTLETTFVDAAQDTTEENLQARCRGVLLMAISNKKGYLVLTTGNKSEVAVGYCTLYGDMAGGFDVLKDVPKTRVYQLARYRNEMSVVIPQRVIDRPPSAELAPDQKDQDSLPPYDILDAILARYVEQDQSAEDIIAAGFDRSTVLKIIRLVDMNEHKRRQAPVGVRMTQRGFGRDRRYPITNAWKEESN